MFKYFKKAKKQLFCKAPFNTLFFSITGDVFMCLKNKKQLIGKYPENSVKEIIESKKLKKIQQDFLKDIPVEGCEYCYTQAGANRTSAAQNYLWDFPIKNKPVVLEFELSNICNLECIMCNSSHSSKIARYGKEIKIPYDSSFVKQIIPYFKYLHKASFRGGEPFLIQSYYILWEALLKKSKAHINITTNATVWNEKIKNLILSRRFNIAISVDTFNKEHFFKIRKNGNFDLYIRNIMRFVELYKAGYCSLSFCVCFMTETRFDIPDIFSFCETHKIPVFINYVEIPQNLSVQFMSIAALAETRNFLIKNGKTLVFNKSAYDTLINFLKEWEESYEANKNLLLISEIIKNIPSIKPKPDLLKNQKAILVEKLKEWPNVSASENFLTLLTLCEQKSIKSDDFMLFCYLINQLPMNKLINEAKENTFENLAKKLENLLALSKEKFG